MRPIIKLTSSLRTAGEAIQSICSFDWIASLRSQRQSGFSLIEIMVALMILAFSFTILILAQARATNLAISAKNISIATELARFQLNDCKQQVKKVLSSISDFKNEGNFAEVGYEQFSWECHAPKFNMKLSTTQVEQATNQYGKKNKDTNNVGSFAMQMITDGLGEAVRELVVIVRWKENNVDEEMRVVTHVTDINAMARLSFMLNQGKNMMMPEKKEEKPKTPGLEQ